MSQFSDKDVERFCQKYEILDDGCWEWTAYKSRDGYGRFRLAAKKLLMAHRASYMICEIGIPDGLVLDHLCRNRACVNPDHLEPVTPGENSRRGETGIFNRSKTHCKHGHEFTEINTGTLLSEGVVKRYCKTCAMFRARKYRKKLASVTEVADE